MLFNLTFSASPPVAQHTDAHAATAALPSSSSAEILEVDDMNWWPLPAWLHEIGATLFQLHRAPIKICTLHVQDLHALSPPEPLKVRLFEETSPFRHSPSAHHVASPFASPLTPMLEFYVEQARGQGILIVFRVLT